MSAAAFVDEPRPLTNRTNPAWGSLLVVLHKGKPLRVVTEGQTVLRGWRAPVTGKLEVARVNTAVVSANRVIRDIMTADPQGFAVEELSLGIQVQLDSADKYAGFRQHVARYGPTFAEALVLEVRNGIEQHVREVFRAKRHADLRATSLHTVLGAEGYPMRFGSGVLLLTGLAVHDVRWSTNYVELTRVEQSTHVEVAKVGQSAAVTESRYDALAPLAARLGIPVELLLDPDRRDKLEGRAHEILLKAMEPENRALHRNPVLMQQLLAATGLTASVPQQESETANRESLDRTAPLAVGSSATVTESVAADGMDLTIDKRIGRVWSANGGDPTRLAGLAGMAANGTATVMAVGLNGTPSVSPALVKSLSGLYGVAQVTVIALPSSSCEELAAGWFAQVRPATSDPSVTLRVETSVVDGLERMRLLVAGPARLARGVVEELSAPDRTELGALENLLPFAGLSVELDESVAL